MSLSFCRRVGIFSMIRQPFRLLRYVSIPSVAIFILVTVLLRQFYHQTIMREMIRLGEDQNVTLAQTFTNQQRAALADFLAAPADVSLPVLPIPPERPDWQRALTTEIHNSTVVTVNIYNLNGVAVFSTDLAQIGVNQHAHPGFQAARAGQTQSELTSQDRVTALTPMPPKRRLVRTFLPLTPNKPDAVAGVLEVSSDITALFQYIQTTERKIAAGIVTILALSYGALFVIIRRAQQIIYQQNAEVRKLSQAVEQSANTIIITDIHGRIEYVNPKFTETTGYTAAEVVGQTPHILQSGLQRPRVYHELWQTILRRKAWQGEFQNKRKDGALYWEHASIAPMLNGHGEMTHFIAVKEDITERKAAEDALQQSQEQLQAALAREQQRRQLSETLRDVACIVSSSLDQEQVVDLIIGQLEHVITYHRVTVSILTGNTLTLIAGRDHMGGFIDAYSFEADKYPINRQVLTSKQPVFIPDVSRDARWQETNTLQGIRSFICAPLLVQEQLIGTLAVGRADETPYTAEDTQTVFAFATQVAIAMRNAQLHAEVRARIEQEFHTAQQIQQSLLPFEFPNIPGLEIAAFCQPAREVGGDFYNFFLLNEHQLGVAVGDVSGKGMQAALMMALSFGLLTTEVRHTLPPAAFMAALNTALLKHTQHNRMNTALGYVTLTAAPQNSPSSWHLRAANAGLIAPLVRQRDGTVAWLNVSGLPLGMVAGLVYEEIELPLNAGDLVLLSSDGIVEAHNPAGELFGFERLTASLCAADQTSAQSVLESVWRDVQAFTQQAEVYDDLTMVVLLLK